MSKYDSIPLKSHKAGVAHKCLACDDKINPGETVYYQSDKFLQTLSQKKFCEECFKKYGQELLEMKFKKRDRYQVNLGD